MYQTQYEKRPKPMPHINMPIIQRQTVCTVNKNGVITVFKIDRSHVSPSYDPNFSTNHSTAFTVFSSTIRRRLLGKTLSAAFNELGDITAESALLPGAVDHLSELFALMDEADDRMTQGSPITEQDVIDYAEKLLGIRNSFAFTYLPGRDKAVGHGEKGKMERAYTCLRNGDAKNAASNMSALFDTLSDGFGELKNYDLLMKYLPQHVGSLRIAFSYLSDVNSNTLEQALSIVEENIEEEWGKRHPGSIALYLNRPVSGY